MLSSFILIVSILPKFVFGCLPFQNDMRQSPDKQLGALWNLEAVTECELHYNALVYNNYGCWCGVGGAHEPVDGIDRCCMQHDACYDTAVDNDICSNAAWEYIDDYSWNCVNNTAFCESTENACKSALCACDVAVVECWKQFPKPAEKARCERTPRLRKW